MVGQVDAVAQSMLCEAVGGCYVRTYVCISNEWSILCVQELLLLCEMCMEFASVLSTAGGRRECANGTETGVCVCVFVLACMHACMYVECDRVKDCRRCVCTVCGKHAAQGACLLTVPTPMCSSNSATAEGLAH